MNKSDACYYFAKKVLLYSEKIFQHKVRDNSDFTVQTVSDEGVQLSTILIYDSCRRRFHSPINEVLC